MSILDQRILIQDVPPEVVWTHISNIAQNPTWQVDCRSVSFLSTRRTGAGVRWRYTSDQGRECVVETTAWYEGLGYEYTFIDGVPFRTSRGRIRLQETPEGTIVQWTLHYETGGVLGGVRNTISIKRHLESAMIDSLKTLWRYIHQSNAGRTVHEPKSLMRDAPDYEARAKYQPRHPSAVKAEQGATATVPEPPVSDEDTRPHMPVTTTEPAAPLNEPDFLADVSIFEPPPHEAAETLSVVEKPSVPAMGGLSRIDTAQISVFDVFGLPKPSDTQEVSAVSVAGQDTEKTTQSAILKQKAAAVALPYEPSGRIGQRVLARRKLVNVRRP